MVFVTDKPQLAQKVNNRKELGVDQRPFLPIATLQVKLSLPRNDTEVPDVY